MNTELRKAGVSSTSKCVAFATGNDRKIAEARRTFEKYAIICEPIAVEIDEIQHSDPAEITKAKARAAYRVLRQPVVVQDTSWDIPALGGFPGGYMKDVTRWWRAQDWVAIMAPHKDRRIFCLEHVAYFDGDSLHHFEARYEGYFVDSPRGSATASNSFEQCISLNDSETLAEMNDRGDFASASDESRHWEFFAQWYQKRL